MKIRAFNLQRGAVIEQFGYTAVVTSVARDLDAEIVRVLVRDAGGLWMELDFCEPVELVGLCVNPDEDDDDFGTDGI